MGSRILLRSRAGVNRLRDEWEEWHCLRCHDVTYKTKVRKNEERASLLICSSCRATHVHVKPKGKIKPRIVLRNHNLKLEDQFEMLHY